MESSKQSLILLSTWTNPVMGGGELFLEKLTRAQSSFFNIYLISNNKTVINYLSKYTILVEQNGFQNNFLFSLVALLKLRKKNGKYHTVILNGQGAFYYSLYCALLFKKVVAIQQQTFNAETSSIKRFVKYLSLGFANKIVAVSVPTANELKIFKNKIVVINNYVDGDFKQKFISYRYQSSSATLNLLYIARVEENKGIKVLVNAISNIDNVHLTILGIGTATEWVKAQNLNHKITFAGWQSDIVPFVSKAHLLIQPSYVEGLPFVPIEMGVAGLPALLSDITVHKEISNNGEFAFLFSTGSVESLSEQIKKLSLDRTLLMEMSDKIQKHYQENYLESDKLIGAYREAFEIRDK